ncbi:hypothetical protein OEZ86_008534 [Tetradesmus obliquus]|nr:hypothetical protein OEZ86_008534 [Tetradesmus obliquus]
MGRGIPSARPGAHASLLWHREINQQMLEEMWHSLVSLLHPALHSQPRSLDELFELLKDATWQDFFQVFPYELREHANYLGHDAYHDELDALALLLASPQSKQRFQRYFEHFAGQLRDAAETAAQLKALAGSRPVPAQVVQAIAERLAASSSVQLEQAPAVPAAAAAAAAAARAEYRWRLLDGDRLFWGPPQAAAAAAAAAGGAAGGGGPPDEYLNFSDSEDERIEGDSEFDDVAEDGEEEDGTDRCAEALAARLTLLGMCSERPLLLLLDEADAAMLQQGSGPQTGGMFRAMLLGVLRQLPQVVLVVTDSFEPDALLDSNSLRRQGRPAVYCLPDGKLSVTSYSISRATYYYSCVHNF